MLFKLIIRFFATKSSLKLCNWVRLPRSKFQLKKINYYEYLCIKTDAPYVMRYIEKSKSVVLTFIQNSWVPSTESICLTSDQFSIRPFFHAVFGSCQFWATRVIYANFSLTSRFEPAIDKTWSFDKYSQQNFEFNPCFDFEFIKTMKNCLLVCHGSWKNCTRQKTFSKPQSKIVIEMHCTFLTHIFSH